MAGGQDDQHEPLRLPGDPAHLVPPSGLQDEDQTVTTLGFPVTQRRMFMWAALMLGVPGTVVGAYRLVQGTDLVGNAGLLAIGLVFLVLGIQLLRLGVTVQDGDVVVRNLLSTTRVPMRDITSVEPLTEDEARAQRGQGRRVFLVLAGRRVRVDVLGDSKALVRAENAQRLRQFLWP
jgi:hypothetical protein